MNAIWTTRAIITTIGDGHVTLDIGGAAAVLPVELPSEERLLGERLYQPVVVALLPVGEARGVEEDLAWHRAEVGRLRALLVDLERSGGVTEVRVELAPRKICITAPTEAGEHVVLGAIRTWARDRDLKNPEVATKIHELEERAGLAEAFAGLLACALSLPQEGKRLGPGPCEALARLGDDKALVGRCEISMRGLLDANKDVLAEETFAVDTQEWGRVMETEPQETT